MEREPRTDYETPAIVDHGDLTSLTASGLPTGFFDADYNQGDPIPPGGPGMSQP